jgi:hypothetical protein
MAAPFASGRYAWPSVPVRLLSETRADGGAGRPVALRGFNLSGSAKWTGLPCSPAGDKTTVDRIRDLLPTLRDDGFDLVRLPIVWERLQSGSSAGELDAAKLAVLRQVVSLLRDFGFYVVIDIHQDLLGSFFRDPKDPRSCGDGFPQSLIQAAYAPADGGTLPTAWQDRVKLPVIGAVGPRHWAINYKFNAPLRRAMSQLGTDAVLDAFRSFAAQLASTFGDLDNVLAYEVLNEPFSETFSVDTHGKLTQAVRAGLGAAIESTVTPTLSVMPAGDWMDRPVSLCTWLREEIDTSVDSIRSRSTFGKGGPIDQRFGGVWLITPHFYDPQTALEGSTPQPAKYPLAVAAAETLFREWDVVPLVGEFGCSTLVPAQIDVLNAWVHEFEVRGWSWCLWDLNPDAVTNTSVSGDDGWCGERYSVACARDGGATELSGAYRSLLRPFIRRYGGPVKAIAWDRAQRKFTATIGKAFQPGWLTELWIPAGLGGFVATGGTANGRTITIDSTNADVSITIDVNSPLDIRGSAREASSA